MEILHIKERKDKIGRKDFFNDENNLVGSLYYLSGGGIEPFDKAIENQDKDNTVDLKPKPVLIRKFSNGYEIILTDSFSRSNRIGVRYDEISSLRFELSERYLKLTLNDKLWHFFRSLGSHSDSEETDKESISSESDAPQLEPDVEPEISSKRNVKINKSSPSSDDPKTESSNNLIVRFLEKWLKRDTLKVTINKNTSEELVFYLSDVDLLDMVEFYETNDLPIDLSALEKKYPSLVQAYISPKARRTNWLISIIPKIFNKNRSSDDGNTGKEKSKKGTNTITYKFSLGIIDAPDVSEAEKNDSINEVMVSFGHYEKLRDKVLNSSPQKYICEIEVKIHYNKSPELREIPNKIENAAKLIGDKYNCDIDLRANEISNLKIRKIKFNYSPLDENAED